ncbi:MAG: C45 family peptidase, partial [Planctomycetota bacterium]|nr:C45 family peptidase [Planctomycetota bacterium]
MKDKTRQSLVVALLCALALSFAVCGRMPAQEANKDAPECEVQVVHLYGTPREKGLALGAAVKERVPILVEKYLMALVPNEQSQKTVVERGLSMEKYIPAEYIEEMKAAAEAAGVTYERILVANTFLDVERTMFCSCFAVKGELTKKGTLLFGRNLDFVHKDIAHKHSVLAIYHGDADHKSFATLTWPGMIGTLSGMNESGLAVAVMNVHGYQDSIEGIPYTLLFRMVLEKCTTVDEAIELVKSSPRTAGNNLMVCDSRKDAVVIEMTCKRVGVRRIKNDAIISTNHFRTKELERIASCPRFSSLSTQIKRVRTAIAGASTEAAEAARIDVAAAAKMLDIVAFNTPLVATMQ